MTRNIVPSSASSLAPLVSAPSTTEDEHRLLVEYLGEKHKPVPFVGREVQLRYLAQWLQAESSPSYALIEAPAAQGKSALLCQFAAYVERNGLANVAFVPVSLRFGLAQRDDFYHRLCAHLAPYGASNPSQLAPSQSSRRRAEALLGSANHGALPLLVIIDGLDEAEPNGWSFGRDFSFPRSIAPGVRVLLSARQLAQRNWLTTLQLPPEIVCQNSRLDTLSHDDIAAAVAQHLPDRSQQFPQLAAELLRVSEGDPLLVGLYFRELLGGPDEATLDPRSMARFRSGLDFYFDRILDELRVGTAGKLPFSRHSLAAHLLAVLAAARGPMLTADLSAYLRLQDIQFTNADLLSALYTLRRVLVGHGESYGFSLTHPKLQEHLFGWLRRHGSDIDAHEHLHEFCQEEHKRACAGKHSGVVAAYALRHLAAHLGERHGNTAPPLERCMPLLSDAWMAAHHRQDGTYAGFQADVQRVWQWADTTGRKVRQRRRAILVQIRSGLLDATISGRAEVWPEDLVVACVQKGLWTTEQALQHVRCIKNHRAQTDTLRLLVPLLSDRQLDEAIEITDTLPWNHRVFLFAPLAERLAPQRRETFLSECLRRPLGQWWHLAEVLAPLCSSACLALALHRSQACEDLFARGTALSAILPYLSGVPRIEGTQLLLESARQAPPATRISALLSLAQHDSPQRGSAAREAWELLVSWEDMETYPAEQLAKLWDLADAVLPVSRAEILAQLIVIAPRPRKLLPSHLDRLAETLVRAGHAEQVLSWNSRNKSSEYCAATAARIAAALPAPLRAVALEQIRACRDPRSRVECLARFTSSAQPEDRHALIEEILSQRHSDGRYVVPDLLPSALIPHLHGNQLEEVLGRVFSTVEGIDRVEQLARLVPIVMAQDRERVLGKLVEGLHQNPVGFRQKHVVAAIALHASAPLLEQICDCFQSVSDVVSQFNAVVDLASIATAASGPAAGERILAKLPPVPGQPERAVFARSYLAQFVPKRDRAKYATQRLAELDSLPESYDRLWNMIALLPSLPRSTALQLTDRLHKDSLQTSATQRPYVLAHFYAAAAKIPVQDRLLDDVWRSLWPSIVHDSTPLQSHYARHLHETLARRHLQEFLPLTYGDWFVSDSWIPLVARLAELGATDEAWQLARQVGTKFPAHDIDAMLHILAHVPSRKRAPLRTELESRLQALDDPHRQIWFHTRLLPYLTPSQREHQLNETVARLASLPPTDTSEVVPKALVAEIKRLPPSDQFEHWSTLLRCVARHDRRRLLQNLGPLAPLLLEFGGVRLLEDVAQTIGDVARQLP